MFTGIVEELGTVKKIKKGANSAVFTIRAEKILDDLKTGDSVAVNGICLTVTACLEDGFTADVMHETLNSFCADSAFFGTACKSGKGNACKWKIWRTHCCRACGWNRKNHGNSQR